MGIVAKLLRMLPNPSTTGLRQRAAQTTQNRIMSTAITPPRGCRARHRPHCATASHVAIEVVAETGSTNADLLARIGTLAGPTLRIAEPDGRPWPRRPFLAVRPGAALMFSLAWRFKGPLHRMSGLPMAVGVALAETIAALGVPVQIKWPNDLLRDGAKLAGILVEARRPTTPSGP
jgi:hypothetical protein